MTTVNNLIESGPRPKVNCPYCDRELFDGIVVKSRVIRINPDGQANAKCRCTKWVTVPLQYQPL